MRSSALQRTRLPRGQDHHLCNVLTLTTLMAGDAPPLRRSVAPCATLCVLFLHMLEAEILDFSRVGFAPAPGLGASSGEFARHLFSRPCCCHFCLLFCCLVFGMVVDHLVGHFWQWWLSRCHHHHHHHVLFLACFRRLSPRMDPENGFCRCFPGVFVGGGCVALRFATSPLLAASWLLPWTSGCSAFCFFRGGCLVAPLSPAGALVVVGLLLVWRGALP